MAFACIVLAEWYGWGCFFNFLNVVKMVNIDDSKIEGFTANELFLLIHIAKRMGADKTCFPSISTLMKDTGFSKPTLLKTKNSLIAKNAISCKQRANKKDGSWSSNLFKVTTDSITVFAPQKEDESGFQGSKNPPIKRAKIHSKKKAKIHKRDNYTCSYCGEKSDTLHVDHIIPLNKNGNNRYSNLTTSCQPCNNQKKDKTIYEFFDWRIVHKYPNEYFDVNRLEKQLESEKINQEFSTSKI